MPTQKVKVQGSVSIGPPTPVAGTFPSLASSIDLTADQSRGTGRSQARTIASPGAYVDLFASLGLTSATHVTLKINGGSLTVRFTTPAGVDQLMSCSRMFVWDSPNTGSGMTALAVQGSADIEIIVAGDP